MKSIFLSDKFVNLINEFKGNAIIIPYKCKTALSRARGYIAYKDRVQFTCNPYYGCLYNCKYCYVPNAFAFKHLRIGNINWGKWIIPKVNFPSILLKELKRLENKNRLKKSVIRLSSISDPFPIIEDEFQLTKTTLNTFLEFTPNWIFIQTKSNLILKYLSILNEIKKNVAIGITITTDNKNIIKEFEPNASTLEERLQILKVFKDNGFYTQAIIAPILPQNSESFARLLKPNVDRVVIKSFLDDGRNGKNIRPIAKKFITKNNYNYLLDVKYIQKTVKIFEKIIGKNKIDKGKEGFIKFPER